MASYAATAFFYVIATVALAEQRQNHVLVFETVPGSSVEIPCDGIRREGDISNWEWKRNGRYVDPLPACKEEDNDEETDVCLTKNGYLVISDADEYRHSGYFQCYALLDGREPVKSKSLVKLEIRRKADSPFILGGDEQLTAVEGSAVSLPCIAIGGSEASVTWSRDGDEDILLGRNVVTSDNSLTIVEVTPESAGTYYCTAANDYGSHVKTVTLNDDGGRTGRRRRRHSSDPIPDPSTPPPFKVLAQPVDTSVVVGSNARFDCLFQGDPHAAVLWYRNRTTKEHPNSLGTFLIATGESTKLKYKILLNHSLVIVNATHDDAGYYTCNLLRTSSNVDFQAKLYVDDEQTEVPTPAQLPTRRHRTPTPFSKTRKPAAPTVPIIGAPEGGIENFKVIVTGPRTIDVSWTYVDPGEAEKRPTNFLVYYVIKEPEETAVSRSVSQKHTLTNLNPFTEYVVYVAAANSFGRGPLSATKTVSTRQDAPGPPVDVDVKTREGEGIIAVTWNAPDEPNGIITGYTIVYQVGGNTEVKVSYPPETRSATIESLDIDKIYTVSVFAITAGGDGEKTSPEEVRVGRVSSTPFTQTVYFYIIIALAAIVALALLILVIVCVRRSRSTGQLEVNKERPRRQRPPPPDRNSYATDDGLNNSVPSPLPYPDSSRQFFPPPPSRPAPTPTAASAAPSLQSTLSPRHAVPPFEPRHSPIGSLDQLKYGYAADGPDLELGRNGKRTRHGSKQAYGLSSYGTTGDIDSMKDRFSVEYSPGEKPRTGSMRAGEPVAGGLKPVHGYRPKMMPNQAHSQQSEL
ncbi:neogenin-like [Oscarella lobularis]|uniref:neogenin-like n=1 Tax=Oscarella lobularis TaxID=121494 RepID=UPI003313EB9C